jgi:hypothetical protein
MPVRTDQLAIRTHRVAAGTGTNLHLVESGAASCMAGDGFRLVVLDADQPPAAPVAWHHDADAATMPARITHQRSSQDR